MTITLLESYDHPRHRVSMSEERKLAEGYKYCECGCGGIRQIVDKCGRPRKYIQYHNEKGNKSSSWKGGKITTSRGYIYILKPEHKYCDVRGYVFEHRLVYEDSHNCCLLSHIHIHHRDSNRSNNIWYNLQPLTHGQHISLEHTGKKVSKATRKALSLVHTGKKQTEQHIQAHRLSMMKDMSNRICSVCGSSKTLIKHNGRSEWFYIEGQLACRKCYRHNKYQATKQ